MMSRHGLGKDGCVFRGVVRDTHVAATVMVVKVSIGCECVYWMFRLCARV